MCTAVGVNFENFLFGRTLDYDFLHPCQVVITPKYFPLRYRFLKEQSSHYAMVGMAYVCKDYPLYFDAMNDHGLCMAGLNFTGNAVYSKPKEKAVNIASFELIPFVLSQCKSVKEAESLLDNINITETAFSKDLPVSQLHWIIADKCHSITVETTEQGVKIYENPVGVLTNNPPFPFHLMNLSNYMNLSPKPAQNRFSQKINLKEYSRGMGALGLPGDFSSQSRFVRVAFVKLNSVVPKGEAESVGQFFHIMDTVSQPAGCCELEEGVYEKTLYTCCCDAERGIYYYTTYNSRSINAVDMKFENLKSEELVVFELKDKERIFFQNKAKHTNKQG